MIMNYWKTYWNYRVGPRYIFYKHKSNKAYYYIKYDEDHIGAGQEVQMK